MPRFFNTAGPCQFSKHYMLPPERRMPDVRGFIEQEQYFVVHAPRQTGKTTSFLTLAKQLTQEGRYAALYTTCEGAQASGGDVERGIETVLSSIVLAADQSLPESLRPPRLQEVAEVIAETRLRRYLSLWAERCPKPLVVFLDEIDAVRDETLIAVLRQLRAGYSFRPEHFPRSMALIGLRDVRDYKAQIRPELDSLGTASPFNIKVESLRLRNFVQDEVAELYLQHTAETGQVFTPEALERAWYWTQGQPWLVNALARQLVEKLVPDRAVPIEAEQVNLAKEVLIERRDTHLDSLVDKLREPRVRRVMGPLLAGDLLIGDRLDDDIAYVEDLGLVTQKRGEPVVVANPIYQEIIPRALAFVTQQGLQHHKSWYVKRDGTLDLPKLLEAFRAFWMEHGEALLENQPYPEAAPHLVMLAFLQRVVNGGGTIDREYAVGSGRMDLCIRWPHPGGVQREALELKVWRDKKADPLAPGLAQLTGYLQRLGLQAGVLVLFDRRSTALPIEERTAWSELTHEGRAITVLRL